MRWLNRKETRQKSVVDEFFAWDNEVRPHAAFDLSEAESRIQTLYKMPGGQRPWYTLEC